MTLPAPSYPITADFVTVEIRQDRVRPSGRLVLMDGVEASHVDLEDPTRIEFEYLRHLVSVIERALPRSGSLRAFQVGGGPCTLARYLIATRPGASVTVAERDGALIEIATTWLGLTPSSRLRVVVGDGREELRRVPDASLDLLVIDAFDGVLVPHRLVTEEFTAEARRALRPGGLHVVNLIDVPPIELAASVARTLDQTYAYSAVVADDGVLAHASSGNVVHVASDRELPLDLVRRDVTRDAAPWKVVSGRALAALTRDAPLLADDVPPTHALATLAPLFGRSSARAATASPPGPGTG